MKIAILGNPTGWYVNELENAAKRCGDMEVDVLSFEHLQATLIEAGRQRFPRVGYGASVRRVGREGCRGR